MTRLPIVGVLGSGTQGHRERSEPLGRWLAGEGVHLLTGGGGGVMAAVSEAFCGVAGRRGLVIGILPGREGDTVPAPGYPNPWVEIPILTHLPLSGTRGTELLSRNHLNVLSSTVLVALPGSSGTASEVALAQRYGRPLVAWLRRPGEIEGLPPGVRVEADFEAIKRFIRDALGGGPGR